MITETLVEIKALESKMPPPIMAAINHMVDFSQCTLRLLHVNLEKQNEMLVKLHQNIW